ncbi:Hypothetical predicted protein [Podarcis lilfordi]|uniref:Uncharacterized protein n=1 Tax=Podarcis lilfordi TaxID=74358 RepID=A0AA35K6M8_9SAUR|nr:Hypothetical predicted protein [Podarcis lilfordi]
MLSDSKESGHTQQPDLQGPTTNKSSIMQSANICVLRMRSVLKADASCSQRVVQKEVCYRAGLIKGAFMGCERISVCLGRKLFDPQKSQTTSRAVKN